MRIRYSPCKCDHRAETAIEVVSANSLRVDGLDYDFDAESVEWPDVSAETEGVILEAKRDEGGELWIVVRRFYSSTPIDWDTGAYHEVQA